MSFSDIWNNFTSSGDSFPELMHDIESHFSGIMKETSKMPQDLYEHIEAFSAAIDWKEPWIIGLLTFHVLLLSTVLLTRKYFYFQTFVFFIICSFIACSEIINSYCADYWRLFSSQNYFDVHGVFAGVFFSGPLLIIGFIQLINFLLLSSSMLITVKRMELKKYRRDNAATADVNTSDASSQPVQDSGKAPDTSTNYKNKKKLDN